MAKQIRYGAYEDFKPEKMVTAELACVVSGDPAVSDGRSVYVCFTPGVVKRLTTYADFERELEAESEEIRSQFTQDIKDAIQGALDAKNAAETFVEQKEQEIDSLITETQKTTSDFVQQAQSDVNTAVTSANASKQAADEATQKALDAADKANEAAGGEIGEKTVTFESDDNLAPASFTTMPLIASGGKLKDCIRSFTTAVKNIRYLFNVLGSSDISSIGDATVTGALAALMRDKLNVSDVVDNLLSTDGNKALSAAMGKQLQGAVDELNTSLEVEMLQFTNSLFTNNIPSWLIKYGKIVVLSVNSNWTNVPQGSSVLFTLPEKYRPIKQTAAYMYGLNNMLLTVAPNGAVSLYNYGNAINQTALVQGNVTWITN